MRAVAIAGGRRLPGGRRRPLLDAGFFALAMAVASSSFWPIHASLSLVVAVGVALIAGMAVATVGALYRWPAWGVGLATVGVYLLLGVPVAVPGRAFLGVFPTVPGLAELVSAAALGWKELLTVSLPVGDYQSLLVPAFLLVLVGSVAGFSVLLRAPLGEFGILAPVVVYLAGIILGPDVAVLPLPGALGLFVVILVFLAWRRRWRRARALQALGGPPISRTDALHDRRRHALRTATGAAVILAVAVVGGVGASAALPATGSRDVLRTAVPAPFDPRAYPSPLSSFRRYFAPERVDRTMLTVSGAEAGDRLRIATLDTYDGVVYTVGSGSVTSASGTFTRLPAPIDRSDSTGRSVRLDVTVGAYRGVFVPDAGDLESLAFEGSDAPDRQDAFVFNATSGTAAVLPGLAEGDRYRLDAVVPGDVATDDLDDLEPGTAPVPDAAVVPDELSATLDTYASGLRTPGERLAAAIAGLQQNGYVSHGGEDEPFSRSGHSADRLSELLTAQPMLGDAEQYAVTAALMARELGFPARVVVGFVVPDDASGTAQLAGSDLSAWIEVDAAGRGWVAVDPNPEIRDIPESQPDDPTTVSRPQSVVPPPPDEQVEPDEVLPPDVAEEDQPPAPPVWLAVLLVVARVLGTVLLVLAILAAPFLTVIGAKWARRRRRRSAERPLERITGGWDEFADAALDYGVDAPATATRNELALAVGGRPPLVLASVVDRATFSPGEPEPVLADRVWMSVGDLREDLARGRTRWERLKALVSLRSFLVRAARKRTRA